MVKLKMESVSINMRFKEEKKQGNKATIGIGTIIVVAVIVILLV
ncbi:MAG: hypothetical protein ABIG89_06775 [Candidatus Woesearchaeota archaeon]